MEAFIVLVIIAIVVFLLFVAWQTSGNNAQANKSTSEKASSVQQNELEKYYIATEEGETQGPYFLSSLNTFYTHGKITEDTLVCMAGGQEWVQFGAIVEREGKNQTNSNTNKPIIQQAKKPLSLKTGNPHNKLESLTITIEVVFRTAGVTALVAGIILLLYSIKEKHAGIGFVYLFSGTFSCLGCFWCAKIINLLSRAVDLLETITKRK